MKTEEALGRAIPFALLLVFAGGLWGFITYMDGRFKMREARQDAYQGYALCMNGTRETFRYPAEGSKPNYWWSQDGLVLKLGSVRYTTQPGDMCKIHYTFVPPEDYTPPQEQ